MGQESVRSGLRVFPSIPGGRGRDRLWSRQEQFQYQHSTGRRQRPRDGDTTSQVYALMKIVAKQSLNQVKRAEWPRPIFRHNQSP